MCCFGHSGFGSRSLARCEAGQEVPDGGLERTAAFHGALALINWHRISRHQTFPHGNASEGDGPLRSGMNLSWPRRSHAVEFAWALHVMVLLCLFALLCCLHKADTHYLLFCASAKSRAPCFTCLGLQWRAFYGVLLGRLPVARRSENLCSLILHFIPSPRLRLPEERSLGAKRNGSAGPGVRQEAGDPRDSSSGAESKSGVNVGMAASATEEGAAASFFFAFAAAVGAAVSRRKVLPCAAKFTKRCLLTLANTCASSLSDRFGSRQRPLNPTQMGVLKALIDWRDQLARSIDESLNFVAPDACLWRVCLAMPTSPVKLRSTCNPLPSTLQQHAQEVVDIIIKSQHLGVGPVKLPASASWQEERRSARPNRRPLRPGSPVESEDPTAAEAPQETPVPAAAMAGLQVPNRVVLEAWPVRPVPRGPARHRMSMAKHAVPSFVPKVKGLEQSPRPLVHVAASFGNRQGSSESSRKRKHEARLVISASLQEPLAGGDGVKSSSESDCRSCCRDAGCYRLFMAAIVEYAKSGRSQCCVCCQKIALDAIRFRMPLEPKWRCLECYATPVVEQEPETEIECQGAGKLSTEDQLLLAELLQTRLKARLGALWLRSEEHRGLRQCAREWARSETESDSASSRVEKPRTKKRRMPATTPRSGEAQDEAL
ncbi:Exosc10 [Symbiodinium microadriaticum]|nr:Exosc10 [Symbiodinium microadriaticum]